MRCIRGRGKIITLLVVLTIGFLAVACDTGGSGGCGTVPTPTPTPTPTPDPEPISDKVGILFLQVGTDETYSFEWMPQFQRNLFDFFRPVSLWAALWKVATAIR